MELVRIASVALFLLFLVFSCEGLPVGEAGGEGLKEEEEEIDKDLALANADLDLLELDIVTNKKGEGPGEGEGRTRRDTVADNSKLWTDGVVPYVLPSFISESTQSITTELPQLTQWTLQVL